MHALSTRNDSPQTASRPFDKDRRLCSWRRCRSSYSKEYEHAVARGANIYAEIVGGAMTADAHHITAPHPDSIGATNVMRLLLKTLT